MPNFFRLYNSQVIDLGPVPRLGWPQSDAYNIPDDYINSKEFVIMRLCNGLGDWGIISAMPRLLKNKYPDCKIYVPSISLIKKIFGDSSPWKHWPQPEFNCERIFTNNPYIDGFIDNIEGDVYHDHYRIYNELTTEEPLIVQMLKFWGLNENESEDHLPELYFTDEEKKVGDKIIKQYIGDEPFGGFICTTSQLKPGQLFDDKQNNLLIGALKQHPLKYVYYGSTNIDETPFKNYINVALNFRDVSLSLREQLYIRSKATINIGYQSSIFDLICRYSKIYCTPMIGGVRENYMKSITYLR